MFFMVLFTLAISFILFFFQNQILRFCSFFIQEYSTLCSFSAFLESLSQISLCWAGFNLGTKHSMFCFGFESLLYNAQHYGDFISTPGHCLQVSSNTPTPGLTQGQFPRSKSSVLFLAPFLYPSITCRIPQSSLQGSPPLSSP